MGIIISEWGSAHNNNALRRRSSGEEKGEGSGEKEEEAGEREERHRITSRIWPRMYICQEPHMW